MRKASWEPRREADSAGGSSEELVDLAVTSASPPSLTSSKSFRFEGEGGSRSHIFFEEQEGRESGRSDVNPLTKGRSMRIQVANGFVEHNHDSSTGMGPADLPRLTSHALPMGRRITLRTVPFGSSGQEGTVSAPGSIVPGSLKGEEEDVASQVVGGLRKGEKGSSLSGEAARSVRLTRGQKIRLCCSWILLVLVLLMVSASFAALCYLYVTRSLMGNWSVTGSLEVSSGLTGRTGV
jgi:hypothetical protein